MRLLGVCLGLTKGGGLLLLGAACLLLSRPGSSDDGFILLAQAQGLVSGHGFQLQPGEGPVECVTSLLDLGIKSAALWTGWGDGMQTLWVATGVLYFAYLGACLYISRKGQGGFLAAACLIACPGVAQGTSYLLETPLYCALLLSAWAIIPAAPRGIRSDCLAALLGLSLVLARPEGLLMGGVLLGARVMNSRGQPALWRALVLWLVACGALFGWRLWLFGTWAPNSYFAKRSISLLLEIQDGALYLFSAALPQASGSHVSTLAHALWVLPVLLTSLLSPLLALSPWSRPSGSARCSTVRLSALCTSAALLAVVLSGGDGYLGMRLLAPVFLLALVSLKSMQQSPDRLLRQSSSVLLGSCLLGAVLSVAPHAMPLVSHWSAQKILSDEDFGAQRQFTTRVHQALAGEPIAHFHAQFLRYFQPDLPVIDLTGITSHAIAHTPTQGRVSLGRTSLQPAFEADAGAVYIDMLAWRAQPVASYGIGALAKSPSLWKRLVGGDVPEPVELDVLQQGYRPASLPLHGEVERWANLFVRADLADQFRQQGFIVRSH